MAFTKSFIYIVAVFFLLTGCASQQSSTTSIPNQPAKAEAETAPVNTHQQPEKLKPAQGSFEPDTLYALLVAELAGQRKRYDMLLSNYLHQARKTRDPGIAERATRIAIYLKADKAALTTALLWAEVAPNDINAKQILAIQLIKANQFEQAVLLLETVLNEGGEANFEYLAASTKHLNQSERNEVLTHFDRLLTTHPDNTRLLFGKVILLQINGRGEEALKTANHLYQLKPDTRNQLLKIRLLHQLGKTKEALKLLTKSLEDEPSDKQIRLLYAQLLIDTKALPEAYQQFSILVEQNPWDSQLRLTLALIALENKQVAEARLHLSRLLQDEKFTEDAHYYLAQMAESDNRLEEAITHYQEVVSGDKAINAHSRLGKLLLSGQHPDQLNQIFQQSRQNNPDNARTFYLLEADLLAKYGYAEPGIRLLTQALDEYPEDINLLYSRAMAAEKINDLGAMEQDLRRILGKEPDNANVLNALGYALADRTDRYHEALELISRANELKPNDPAITDSLGWAFFRLGNYQESIKLLEKALAEFPDHEVAAHLGEVLWITGQHERAKQIWSEALKRKPDSLIIKRVLERLNPEQLK
ncbi:MAG: tetratricopeptide repeat protein [Pseudomonadales bacterium]|nr:tetratricopeptide repeat protein [Pseudomonadales bacterium]